ncbi:MAG: hydantoinase B/oxoprolinase family protein, partial [bacterium]|nr:hydantoinase B/oxoprolinase family protein [bacterium]
DIPVHLGSMPASVEAALAAHKLDPGDVLLLNDPYSGGTHLPDLTVVAPCFAAGSAAPIAIVANRAHHADVGGVSSGSLPLSGELFQEGLVIPPVKVVRRGRLQHDIVEILAANSRTPDERRGDLLAQLGSLERGKRRISEFTQSLGPQPADAIASIYDGLISASAVAARDMVCGMPESQVTGSASIELPDGIARIRVAVRKRNSKLLFDFSATDAQHGGPFNAVRAITVSAVFYVIRCLLPPEVPTTAGLQDAFEVVTKPGTLVDALHPAAVAAGNVETSQRIVLAVLDAVRKLLPGKMPAASQGTMNNLLIGSNASDSCRAFAYYETIAGGHGGSQLGSGLSARHSHMTNSLNTPVEALEHAYPLRVRRYAIRANSGGAGLHHGGDGIVREVEFLRDSEFTLLRQSCVSGPSGALGGHTGAPGKAVLWNSDQAVELPASCTRKAKAGERLVIETPGGGGWGRAKKSAG